MKLEVGKKYMRRDGSGPVEIVGLVSHPIFTHLSSDNFSYLYNGMADPFCAGSNKDLVSEWVEKPKYKAGDLVTMKIGETDAFFLNSEKYFTAEFQKKQIIKHEPAPEPLTGTLVLNIYGDGTAKAFKSRAEADEAAKQKRLAKHVIRLACHVIKWTEGQGL